MNSFQVLGYANCKPIVVLVDCTSPYSLVSTVFLFRNNVHNHLSPTGNSYAHLMVASQGGYYTFSNMHLVSSMACTIDVVLGADWLGSCQITMAVNALQQLSSVTVASLPDGHGWTADSHVQSPFCLGCLLFQHSLACMAISLPMISPLSTSWRHIALPLLSRSFGL